MHLEREVADLHRQLHQLLNERRTLAISFSDDEGSQFYEEAGEDDGDRELVDLGQGWGSHREGDEEEEEGGGEERQWIASRKACGDLCLDWLPPLSGVTGKDDDDDVDV